MRNWLVLVYVFFISIGSAQNTLFIPDTLAGTQFSLTLQNGTTNFYGTPTSTMGANGPVLGPTLLLTKGDSVNISVNNQLMDSTTIHWHGLHVSSKNDGGPHTVIPPNTLWTPSFKVRDEASTYWYHPHLHMHTNEQVVNGIAGLIIVRDSNERTLNLPRTYGVDDIPLIIQTKAFNSNKQFIYTTAMDTAVMVNATLNPEVTLPAQIVRLRLLNAASERVMEIGFSNNHTFYMIASDGGLLEFPVVLTRLRLSPGERAEILLNLSGLTGNLTMMSFGSELPNAIYGASQPGMGPGQTIPNYSLNPLNGNDYQILKINIQAALPNAILSIPNQLTTLLPLTGATNATRTLTFSPVNMGPTAIQGPFLINNSTFNMNVVNYSIPLDNTETWTLTNNSPIAHPFHIHDVQFFIQNYAGSTPPAQLSGRKDVVLVPAMSSVTFKTKFETFCDDMIPYMYHCHMLPHEDDGMMGQFTVNCPSMNTYAETKIKVDCVFPNPARDKLNIELENEEECEISIHDLTGNLIKTHRTNGKKTSMNVEHFANGMYFLIIKKKKETVLIKKIIKE